MIIQHPIGLQPCKLSIKEIELFIWNGGPTQDRQFWIGSVPDYFKTVCEIIVNLSPIIIRSGIQEPNVKPNIYKSIFPILS